MHHFMHFATQYNSRFTPRSCLYLGRRHAADEVPSYMSWRRPIASRPWAVVPVEAMCTGHSWVAGGGTGR